MQLIDFVIRVLWFEFWMITSFTETQMFWIDEYFDWGRTRIDDNISLVIFGCTYYDTLNTHWLHQKRGRS